MYKNVCHWLYQIFYNHWPTSSVKYLCVAVEFCWLLK